VAGYSDVDVPVLTTSCIDVPGFDAVKAPRCLLRPAVAQMTDNLPGRPLQDKKQEALG
jgi:hypothetical protein